MDSGVRSARNELFQELKPRCVELSQLALRDDSTATHTQEIIHSTSQLLEILERKCCRTDGVFDEKLAEYVFFPLSQILRRKRKYTDHLSELTLRCLRISLEYGWRKGISLDLGRQLLLLLTFIAGGVPGKESVPAPEELVVEAYGSLAALLRDLGATAGGASSLVESGTIPALGHSVSVLLEGIIDGPSAEVQLQALHTLDELWHCIKDAEALAGFLPGTISALTKCLMPGTATRRTGKTIVKALEVLQYVLIIVLSDVRTRNIRNDLNSPSGVRGEKREGKMLSPSWLKATAGQIKLALSNIIRLRNHESVEVKKSLNKLCLSILDECHDTLKDSATLLVETCMSLAGIEEEEAFSERRTNLLDLASIHSDLGELVKNTVYNWVTSLPRVMQSTDEMAKQTALGQLSKAHNLLTGLNLESTVLNDAFGSSLRDSITVTLETSPTKVGLQEEVELDLHSQAVMNLASESTLSTQFRPIILAEESQKQVRNQLTTLFGSLGGRSAQINMASEMLEYARGASGPGLLSAYWLSSQILRSAESQNKDLDELFESSLTMSDDQEAINQELYSYSISVLSESSDNVQDWRLQAIALEVMADAAQRMKKDFRTELVDVLYPVTQLLGSSTSRLREHAITCLNIISQSCQYANTSELIVDNVDYMVNAISLRLNTFDISPQAPQVLVMMIRLTGPSLLLYLDDVVGSIFAALDNFHGYNRLVEILFSVLEEIVSVGSKSRQLRIEDTPSSINHRKLPTKGPTIEEILKLLLPKPRSTSDSLEHESAPRKPWKSAKELMDEAEAETEEADSEEEQSGEVAKAPPSKTYSMLQSITRLSQHYLTNQSPVLRAKLLSLISTSSAALYSDEDNFLPLINDIWPVVIQRLYDTEHFVQIAAAETTAELCRCAGDFLTTRIQDEWSDLTKLARQVKTKAAAEKRGKGGRGIYSQINQLWEAIIKLCVAIALHVRIENEMFDDLLELLAEALEREEVRAALEATNRDAVWLALEILGKNPPLRVPAMDGYEFVALDTVKSSWT